MQYFCVSKVNNFGNALLVYFYNKIMRYIMLINNWYNLKKIVMTKKDNISFFSVFFYKKGGIKLL